MALKTLVKVGSITNLSDARYCAGMGVDLLGFRVVAGQPEAVSAKVFQEIRGWITGPQIVAEIYGISDADAISQIIEDYRPDYLELSTREWALVGSRITLPYILALNGDEVLSAFENPPAYVLTRIPDTQISGPIAQLPVLASISDPGELDSVLRLSGVQGINLTGGKEIRPGLKQYDQLAEILEALESD